MQIKEHTLVPRGHQSSSQFGGADSSNSDPVFKPDHLSSSPRKNFPFDMTLFTACGYGSYPLNSLNFKDLQSARETTYHKHDMGKKSHIEEKPKKIVVAIENKLHEANQTESPRLTPLFKNKFSCEIQLIDIKVIS